jgi:multidrug efflux pump subunit AcrB/outer membrane protein TolC
MNSSEMILKRGRFFWFLGISFSILGIYSYLLIPKEEDPALKPRLGFIKLVYPGASAVEMRRLLVNETEKELASVDSIKTISTVVRSDFAGIKIELKDTLADFASIDRAFDEIEDSLSRARRKFPQGALTPELDRKLIDTEAILISIDAPETIRHDILLDLEDELLKLNVVSRIKRHGNTEKQVSLYIKESELAQKGINLQFLLNQIQASNLAIPGGYIEREGKKINVVHFNSFQSINDILEISIFLPGGSSTKLSTLVEIEMNEKKPISEEMRWNGKTVYGLGVVPRKGIDLMQFGKEIEEIIQHTTDSLRKENPEISIEIINSQPLYVKQRLIDLFYSLLQSMLLLGGFLILFMGFRIGLLVSFMLPVITLISFSIFKGIGGVLQQIAIAAFVLSLGILIDNVIVMVEGIQEKIDRGVSSEKAAIDTISEFVLPLLSSSVTTIASFLPMWMAGGVSSEFTASIPTIVIISLCVSYLGSIFLSPSISLIFLKKKEIEKNKIMESLGNLISKVVNQKSYLILLGVVLLISISVFSLTKLKLKFFPSADRNQLILEIRYPEGTSFSTTKKAILEIEDFLKKEEKLSGYASFIGRSTPYFYYNLNQKINAPHLSQMILISRELSFPMDVQKRIESYLNQQKKFQYSLRTLEQGPPTEANIVVRIYSEDLQEIQTLSKNLIEELKDTPEIKKIWTEAIGTQTEINLNSDNKSLSEYGLTKADISLSILKTTSGVFGGYLKTERESIPLYLTSKEKEKTEVNELLQTVVGHTQDRDLRAKSFIKYSEKDTDSVLYLRNRNLHIPIFIDLKKNENPTQVFKICDGFIQKHSNSSIRFEYGGEQEESKTSNLSLAKAMPTGVIILLAALLWEFNSFRLMGIILTAAPTAFLGIVPGLAISGKPFGFLSLLALFALIGIAVNNGIILIDVLENSNKKGIKIDEVIRLGITSRLRPILLTTGSTILGMVPLTISSSTLWPPFAFSMISGLIFSTLFTLFIVPYLYKLYHSRKKSSTSGVVLLCFLCSFTQISGNESNIRELSLEEAMNLSLESPKAKATWHDIASVDALKDTAKYAAYFPKVGILAERVARDRDIYLAASPFSPFVQTPFGNTNYYIGGLELYQTLWNSELMSYKIPSAGLLLKASQKKAEWERVSIQYSTAMIFLDCKTAEIKKNTLDKRIQNQEALLREGRKNIQTGKISQTDFLKIELGLGDLKNGASLTEVGSTTCKKELARMTNITDEFKLGKISLDNKDTPQIANRPDLEAFRLRIDALILEKNGILSESMPEVYVRGNLIYNNQGNIEPFNYSQVGIGLKMRILDGGTQISRTKQKEEEILSLEEEYRDTVNRVNISRDDSKNRVKSMETNLLLIRKDLEISKNTLSIERNKFNSGRSIAIPYLQIQDMVLEREEKKVLSEIELYRSKITESYLSGNLVVQNMNSNGRTK